MEPDIGFPTSYGSIEGYLWVIHWLSHPREFEATETWGFVVYLTHAHILESQFSSTFATHMQHMPGNVYVTEYWW